jgi:transcriptional regulator with XRE-family HTH domain
MSIRGAERLRYPIELAGPLSAADYLEDRLGRQVRELRKAKGVTLQTLADETGLSVGYLSQIERGRSQLTVNNLMQIAGALDVHLNWFFQNADRARDDERDVVVRRRNRRRIRISGAGLTEELLTPSLAGPLEMLMSVIEPGGESGENYSHKGDEAGVVIEGELELWVGERHFRLETGDSFSFASSTPHRWRNPGEVTTRVVWTITPPSY